MSDPLQTDAVRPPEGESGGERDPKVESLLLTGLDHYFAAEYEQAINVWTRVLFLDRGHGRARAYIERARSALAEQQRESEELLQNGVAAFERGETGTARRLLDSAVERGGAQDVALAFLARLNRLDMAAQGREGQPHAVVRRTARGRHDVPRRGSRSLRVSLLVVLGLAGALALAASWQRFVPATLGLEEAPAGELAAPRSVQEPLVVPRSSEVALERARALYRAGRLHDALRIVDLVRPADPLRQEADRVKADIQRELLANTGTGAGTAGPGPPVSR